MTNPSESPLYEKMLNLAEENKSKYLTCNGRNVLNLPWHVPMGVSIVDFMKDAFNKYIALVDDACENRDFYKRKKLFKIKNGLLRVLESYLQGDTASAYNSFSNVMKNYFADLLSIIDIRGPETFYRARKGNGFKNNKDFYHVPFNQRNLTKSERFSIAGYPCLYIGYSEEVCIKEVDGDCSLITLKLKNEEHLKICDLTELENKDGSKLHNFIELFPLIASCYVVPFYCVGQDKVCPSVIQNFREEYIIPQFLTMYLLKNRCTFNLDGIRYYTVKDVNLDTREKNDVNLILFTDLDRSPNLIKAKEDKTSSFHDKVLLNKFIFESPHDS